jgi:hypothetical protein
MVRRPFTVRRPERSETVSEPGGSFDFAHRRARVSRLSGSRHNSGRGIPAGGVAPPSHLPDINSQHLVPLATRPRLGHDCDPQVTNSWGVSRIRQGHPVNLWRISGRCGNDRGGDRRSNPRLLGQLRACASATHVRGHGGCFSPVRPVPSDGQNIALS